MTTEALQDQAPFGEIEGDLRVVRPAMPDIDSAAAAIYSNNVPETDYAEWANATSYVIGDRVRVTVPFAGPPVVPATHMVYECSVAGAGKPPPNNLTGTTPAWLKVSATNRYKMFDQENASQTENPDEILVVLEPGRVDSLYLGGLDAQTVIIRQTDPVSGNEIYYHEEDLSLNNVKDWYEYFTEPIVRRTDLILFDLLTYSNARTEIRIINTGSTAKCGSAVPGLKRDIGEVLWGVGVRLTDYSVYKTNSFGQTELQKRGTGRLVNGRIYVKNKYFDETVRLMAEFTSVNLLWSFSEEYGSLNVFGFRKDFDSTLESPAGSYFDLQVQGLT